MTDNYTTWLVQQLNDEKAHVLLPAMIFLGGLMAMGVIGNALVIFYYGYMAKTTTGIFFILSLAVFDFLACAIGIPIEILDMMFFYTFENDPLCKISMLVNPFLIVVSAFTLCAIAVDRYRRIVKPFDRQISMRQAKITCTVCIGLAVALSWPTSFFYGVVPVDVPNTDNRNIIGFDCTTEKDPALKPYALVYSVVQFVGFGGVTITLVVAYLLVGRQLYRHRQYQFYVAQRSLRTSVGGKAGDTAGSQTDDSTEPQATTLQPTDNDTTIHPSPYNNPFGDEDAYVKVEYEGPDFGDSLTPQLKHIPDFSKLPEVQTSSTPTRAFGFRGLINGILTKVTSSASGDYRMRTSSTSSASAKIRRARRDHSTTVGSAADDSRQTDIERMPGSSSSADDKCLKMLDTNTVRYTVMMLIIAAVFNLSMLPYLGLWCVWRLFQPDDVVYTLPDAELVWLQIAIRSYFINCTVNPLIYGLFNSQFRAFLYNGVCGVCFRKQATLSDNKNSDTNSKYSPRKSGTDINPSSRITL